MAAVAVEAAAAAEAAVTESAVAEAAGGRWAATPRWKIPAPRTEARACKVGGSEARC